MDTLRLAHPTRLWIGTLSKRSPKAGPGRAWRSAQPASAMRRMTQPARVSPNSAGR